MCRVERKKRKAWSVGNATVFGQWAGAGQPDVCAVGGGGVKWMEAPSPAYCPGHNGIVGSLLYDSPVGGVLWSCGSVLVASLGA